MRALLDNSHRVSYSEIEVPHGHDAFLFDDRQYHEIVAMYFDRIAQEVGA